jgi:hypothetical protein
MTDPAGPALRVLVAKGSGAMTGRVWLDRLCRGLLSWSRERSSAARVAELPLLLVVLDGGPINRVYLWEGTGAPPWAKLREAREADGRRWELFVPADDFTKAELKEGEGKLGPLQVWRPEPELVWEGGAPA